MNPMEIKGICYLTYAGSIAYGTNTADSDVDIRGFYQESLADIISGKVKDTIEDSAADTVVYSLRHFVSLCKNANPNVFELLGTRDEHVIFINDVGRLFRENKHLFYSKRVFKTFGGYATSQLRRIQDALATDSYAELRHRNRKKDAAHFFKDAMHLIRLYLMGIDLLEGRGLQTYREKDLDLLRAIRNGDVKIDEIFAMAETFEEKMKVAYANSTLPPNPDVDAINKLLYQAYGIKREGER